MEDRPDEVRESPLGAWDMIWGVAFCLVMVGIAASQLLGQGAMKVVGAFVGVFAIIPVTMLVSRVGFRWRVAFLPDRLEVFRGPIRRAAVLRSEVVGLEPRRTESTGEMGDVKSTWTVELRTVKGPRIAYRGGSREDCEAFMYRIGTWLG